MVVKEFVEVKIVRRDAEQAAERRVQTRPISSSVRWSSPSCRTKVSEVEILQMKELRQDPFPPKHCAVLLPVEKSMKARQRGSSEERIIKMKRALRCQ